MNHSNIFFSLCLCSCCGKRRCGGEIYCKDLLDHLHLDNVVDERVPEVPLQLQVLVLQDVLDIQKEKKHLTIPQTLDFFEINTCSDPLGQYSVSRQGEGGSTTAPTKRTRWSWWRSFIWNKKVLLSSVSRFFS